MGRLPIRSGDFPELTVTKPPEVQAQCIHSQPDPAPAAVPIHAKFTKDAQICGSFTELQDQVMSTGTECLENYGLMHFFSID